MEGRAERRGNGREEMATYSNEVTTLPIIQIMSALVSGTCKIRNFILRVSKFFGFLKVKPNFRTNFILINNILLEKNQKRS
jgi:hypothetical protein